jgi:hypothetical protein
MSAFGHGSNEEYLVHVIAIKHLLEQKGTIQDVGKAFGAIVEVRKQLELLLEALERKRNAEKYEQRKKLSAIKEDLKAACKLVVVETLKAYELFRCFVVIGEVQTQWDKIVQEMHSKDPWIGMNGQSVKGLHALSWLSFQDCIKLHKLNIFPDDAAEKQRFYMQQTIKKPQQVTVHQYMSCMGVLNDFLAYLPMVYDSSMAIESTKKCNVPFDEADLVRIVLNSVPVT